MGKLVLVPIVRYSRVAVVAAKRSDCFTSIRLLQTSESILSAAKQERSEYN